MSTRVGAGSKGGGGTVVIALTSLSSPSTGTSSPSLGNSAGLACFLGVAEYAIALTRSSLTPNSFASCRKSKQLLAQFAQGVLALDEEHRHKH